MNTLLEESRSYQPMSYGLNTGITTSAPQIKISILVDVENSTPSWVVLSPPRKTDSRPKEEVLSEEESLIVDAYFDSDEDGSFLTVKTQKELDEYFSSF